MKPFTAYNSANQPVGTAYQPVAQPMGAPCAPSSLSYAQPGTGQPVLSTANRKQNSTHREVRINTHLPNTICSTTTGARSTRKKPK